MSQPADLEAERAVLGAVLLSESVLSALVEEGLRQEDFYWSAHEHVYGTMLRMRRDGEPVDLLTLRDRLKRDRLFEQVGGQQQLDLLVSATPNVSNHRAYARLVVRAAMWRERRRLLQLGLEAVDALAEADYRATLGTVRQTELHFRPLLERETVA